MENFSLQGPKSEIPSLSVPGFNTLAGCTVISEVSLWPGGSAGEEEHSQRE